MRNRGARLAPAEGDVTPWGDSSGRDSASSRVRAHVVRFIARRRLTRELATSTLAIVRDASGIDPAQIDERIYRRFEHGLVPYIGAAYVSPQPEDLRVMAIGINSYASEKDWPPHPGWLRGWYAERTHRFHKSVWRSAATLGAALTAPGMLFAGRKYDASRSLYATNGVKECMREAEGKRVDQLPPDVFAKYDEAWREELRLLAEGGVMPHVMIVLGAPFWERAWRALHPGSATLWPSVKVTRYEAAEGDDRHRANRIRLETPAGEHEVLLLKLRHPAARVREGSAKWVMEREAVRRLASGSERVSG